MMEDWNVVVIGDGDREEDLRKQCLNLRFLYTSRKSIKR